MRPEWRPYRQHVQDGPSPSCPPAIGRMRILTLTLFHDARGCLAHSKESRISGQEQSSPLHCNTSMPWNLPSRTSAPSSTLSTAVVVSHGMTMLASAQQMRNCSVAPRGFGPDLVSRHEFHFQELDRCGSLRGRSGSRRKAGKFDLTEFTKNPTS